MSIPYYWVHPRNGRAYWRPNRRMQTLGFSCVALGPAGDDAEQAARVWNMRWQQVRKDEVSELEVRDDAVAGPTFVYFVQMGSRIKIGISSQPFVRLQSLGAGLPDRVSRAVVVPGSPDEERLLHARFAAHRLGGEWFEACRPVLLAMARCAAQGRVVHESGAFRLRHKSGQKQRVESQALQPPIAGQESNRRLES